MDCEGWSLEDDLKLVSAILHCGYGNWTDVAARFKNKSPTDCKNHYLEKFIVNPDNDELKEIVTYCQELRNKPSLCSSHCNLSVEPDAVSLQSVIEFLDVEKFIKDMSDVNKNKTNDTLKSSGKISGEITSVGRLDCLKRTRNFTSNIITCSNYNPFRNEFDVEYDDSAETVLEVLWEPPDSLSFNRDEDNALLEELKYALADSYNFRLSERIDRKKVIRSHGLIDSLKTYNMMHRFHVPFGTTYLSTLFAFMKFIEGPNLDFLVGKLYYENELRNKVNSLLMYRSLGIRFLNGIHIYEKLNKRRLKYRKEIGYSGRLPIEPLLETRQSRRPSAPLTLHNLPGFHLLDEEEKHLCSTARIVPETYYSFKKLLKSECLKHDGLKLAQARQLLKIDVNKTRKMYDYLMSTGDIW